MSANITLAFCYNLQYLFRIKGVEGVAVNQQFHLITSCTKQIRQTGLRCEITSSLFTLNADER